MANRTATSGIKTAALRKNSDGEGVKGDITRAQNSCIGNGKGSAKPPTVNRGGRGGRSRGV